MVRDSPIISRISQLRAEGGINDLVTFSGFSGSGKTTLIDRIVELFDGIALPSGDNLKVRKAQRYTTREPRENDDPTENLYLTLEEFDKKVQAGEIPIHYHSQSSGHYYGWDVEELLQEKNEIVIVTVNDAEGASWLKCEHDPTSVFVEVSQDEVIRRIKSRGGTKKQIEDRIARLGTESPEPLFDVYGTKHELGSAERFYHQAGISHGLAELVIVNEGDIDTVATTLFSAIVGMAQNKRIPNYIPCQLKYSFCEEEGVTVPRVDLLRSHFFVDDNGRPITDTYTPSEKDANDSVDQVTDRDVTLMHVKPRCGSPDYYAVRVSPQNEEVDLVKLRQGFFRGCHLRDVANWKLDASNAPAFVTHLVGNDFRFSKPQLNEYLSPHVDGQESVVCYDIHGVPDPQTVQDLVVASGHLR
jgi:guanylate kinase